MSSRQAVLTEHNYSKRSAETQSALMTGCEMLVKLESIRQLQRQIRSCWSLPSCLNQRKGPLLANKCEIMILQENCCDIARIKSLLCLGPSLYFRMLPTENFGKRLCSALRWRKLRFSTSNTEQCTDLVTVLV